MLILMSGLPSSGKSVVVDMFKSGNDLLLRPEDWMPNNIDILGADAEKEYRIACWKMAIEKSLEAVIETKPSSRIILDCTNSKFFSIASLIGQAKAYKHRVVLVFVSAKVQCCEQRSGLARSIYDEYVENFKHSLPRYKSACDDIIVIRNDGDKQELIGTVSKIAGRICHTT